MYVIMQVGGCPSLQSFPALLPSTLTFGVHHFVTFSSFLFVDHYSSLADAQSTVHKSMKAKLGSGRS
jgi:hypothetical protein